MSRSKFKDVIRFFGGFILERPEIDAPLDYAASGSRNVLFTGQAEPEPFKGLELVAGIGAVGATPVSDGIGAFGTTPAGDFDLSALTNDSACTTPDVVEMVGDSLHLKKNAGSDTGWDEGFTPPAEFVTNSGTLKWTFGQGNDKDCSIGLTTSSFNQSCNAISNLVGAPVGTLSFGVVIEGGDCRIWFTGVDQGIFPTDSDDVWSIRVNGTDLTVHQNGTEMASTSTDGSELFLKVNFRNVNSEVYVTRYSENYYIQ